eukprot:1105385_1
MKMNVFFAGGYYTIRVESIRNMETQKNYEDVFRAMYIFDCMLSGVAISGLKIKKNDKIIMERLLEKTDLEAFDPYIVSTFKAYAAWKRSITIMMFDLYKCFKGQDMYHLVIPSDLDVCSIEDDVNDYHNLSTCNLVSSNLFKIFSNVKYVNIETMPGFAFNLLEFLEVISLSSTWIKIRVSSWKLGHKTWISLYHPPIFNRKSRINIIKKN